MIPLLQEFPAQPQRNPPEDEALYHESARKHPGRMRLATARGIVKIYCGYRKPWLIYDPMVGTGTTFIAAAESRSPSIGCELAPQNAPSVKGGTVTFAEDARYFWPDMDCCVPVYPYLVMTSPPFPGAHSQGSSKAQREFQETCKTYAGNSYVLEEEWGLRTESLPRKHRLWVGMLRDVMRPSVQALEPGGWMVIHIKDFVRKGYLIDTTAWVLDAIGVFPQMAVEGQHLIPIEYGSIFQNRHKYPTRTVTRTMVHRDNLSVQLDCEHIKVYQRPQAKLPARSVCPRCPELSTPQVRHEKLVVFRKEALRVA